MVTIYQPQSKELYVSQRIARSERLNPTNFCKQPIFSLRFHPSGDSAVELQ